MTLRNRRYRDAPAFGLVEMLVVILIIGILAVILIPRLTGGKDPVTGKKAPAPRERARQVQGAEYIGQLNQAILMYRQDYEDMNPPTLYSLVGTYGVTPEMILDPNTRQPLPYDPRTGSIGGPGGQTGSPYGLGGNAGLPRAGGF